ncbi:MAG TPA: hypothetical protein VME18_09300 [Acidobacteriaceae bacterium]|nr:hypothetical protein [Acidobacteriaceae bacterium]
MKTGYRRDEGRSTCSTATLTFSCAASCTAAASTPGVTIEKTVPERCAPQRLRTCIFQPLRRKISPVTHNPGPVPVLPFVVTNGSKIVGSSECGMPDPVSPMVRRTLQRVGTQGLRRKRLHLRQGRRPTPAPHLPLLILCSDLRGIHGSD